LVAPVPVAFRELQLLEKRPDRCLRGRLPSDIPTERGESVAHVDLIWSALFHDTDCREGLQLVFAAERVGRRIKYDSVARLDAAMTRARLTVTDRHYSVLPLSRRGWVSGSDSLLSSLLSQTGLFNAAGSLGIAAGGYVSLEAIVKAKPDFLLVSEAGDRAEDDGRAFLLHPALERFYPPEKRIVIPDRLTVCGGVMLAEALDVLVAELKRVAR